jgi:hypothetical protein
MPDDNLSRLAHFRPDLADRVRAGAMSVHDALVLAGTGPGKPHKGRQASAPVPIPPEPEAAAGWLLERFQGRRREALIAALLAGAKVTVPEDLGRPK